MLNVSNSAGKKTKFRKNLFKFHNIRWTGFLMKPLTTLFGEYFYRQKLTEKKPFEYIVHPPPGESEQQ